MRLLPLFQYLSYMSPVGRVDARQTAKTRSATPRLHPGGLPNARGQRTKVGKARDRRAPRRGMCRRGRAVAVSRASGAPRFQTRRGPAPFEAQRIADWAGAPPADPPPPRLAASPLFRPRDHDDAVERLVGRPLPPPEAFTRLCDAAGAGVAARASGDASGGGRGLFATADAPRGAHAVRRATRAPGAGPEQPRVRPLVRRVPHSPLPHRLHPHPRPLPPPPRRARAPGDAASATATSDAATSTRSEAIASSASDPSTRGNTRSQP